MSIVAAVLAAVSVAANLTGHTTTAILAGLGAGAAGVAFHVRRRRQANRG
ncbi:hypothetical protein O7600_20105 [Micromonospora sp. WMMA1998]|nr:hypothetical protein [Micromonospora sp. WMMA1998]WBC13435.1 hypothetical protein O7600_20105 [Micromonospora sp. WMMA1998]